MEATGHYSLVGSIAHPPWHDPSKCYAQYDLGIKWKYSEFAGGLGVRLILRRDCIPRIAEDVRFIFIFFYDLFRVVRRRFGIHSLELMLDQIGTTQATSKLRGEHSERRYMVA